MGRLVAATVAVAVGLTACAAPAADPGAPWAEGGEAVVSLLEAAYDTGDPYEMSRFFTAGGTLGAYSAATGGGRVERTAEGPPGTMTLFGEISTG